MHINQNLMFKHKNKDVLGWIVKNQRPQSTQST